MSVGLQKRLVYLERIVNLQIHGLDMALDGAVGQR
jgi:hypothetical protein